MVGLGLPRNAVSLKQNWGVKAGLADGCDIFFPGGSCGSCGRVQKIPATLMLVGSSTPQGG